MAAQTQQAEYIRRRGKAAHDVKPRRNGGDGLNALSDIGNDVRGFGTMASDVAPQKVAAATTDVRCT